MFPIERYKYFTNNKNKVIAEQTFAGKKYRGVAILNNADKFDYETGKTIAAAKCDEKICRARYLYAKKKLDAIEHWLAIADEEYKKVKSYYEDSAAEMFASSVRLNEVLLKNK